MRNITPSKLPLILALALALPLALPLASCKKYPDGPALSLRTKKARMANTWIIEKYLINDVDQTSNFNTAYPGYTLDVNKEGRYTITITSGSTTTELERGQWYFAGEKDVVKFLPDGSTVWSGGASVWQILRLKDKEAWGEYTNSFGDKSEIHLKEK